MNMSASGALADGASVSSTETPAIPRDALALAGSLVARDGAKLHQRAIHADDAARLQAFHRRLSREAIVFRFFGALPELGAELARRLSLVDYENRMAVVVTLGEGAEEQIIAVARYQRDEPEAAEIALVVEDRWQGQGIGHTLLWTLATYARQRGFATLIAKVMYENDRMLTLLRHSGLPTAFNMHEGRIEARLDIIDLNTPAPLIWDTAP